MTPTANTSSDSDSDSDSTTGNAGVSYALIHEVSSLADFEKLEDPESIEAQIARNRGQALSQSRNHAQQTDTDPSSSSSSDDTENDPTTYDVEVEEGKLKIDSGYVIRFVDEKHHGLTPFDVIGLDELRAYPAPEPLIESLTARMRGHLKEHGYVKVRGAYVASEKRFYGAQMGWDANDDFDVWDRIMEVINEVSTTPAAVDYVYIKDGPDRWGPEEVADARGIATSSVEGNVRAIENELDT